MRELKPAAYKSAAAFYPKDLNKDQSFPRTICSDGYEAGGEVWNPKFANKRAFAARRMRAEPGRLLPSQPRGACKSGLFNCPIVPVTAVFFASFNVELVCATSDFFVKRRVPCGARCSLFSPGGFHRLGLCTPISPWFCCHTYLPSGLTYLTSPSALSIHELMIRA